MIVARHNKASKKGRWPSDYRSQQWAADQLQVNRSHLNRVLRGHRQSQRLLRRYLHLMKEAA